MVQIKQKILIKLKYHPKLSIPYGSDKTEVDNFSAFHNLAIFLSHMVQIKPYIPRKTEISEDYFLSHMVQIKQKLLTKFFNYVNFNFLSHMVQIKLASFTH